MRGRGRGRGRGGRGGGRRNRQSSAQSRTKTKDVESEVEESKNLNIESDPREFFVGTVSVAKHLEGQDANRTRYAATLAVLEHTGVAVAQNARIRALAAAWARNDYQLSEAFLKNRSQFGLVEVLKALTLLDSGRQVRVLEKKVKRLQLSGTKVGKSKMGKLKSDIDNLNAIKPPRGSASGAVCKHIRSWVRSFTAEDLEFYALHYPKDPWMKLADICHFNPKLDFSSLPWFLPFCFGGPAPENSMVEKCHDVIESNVNELIKEYPVPYSHIKTFKNKLTDESKERIAGYEETLDTLLWYYEDLQLLSVDSVIQQRLDAGEKIKLPNGKLLERLLTLKIIRENISAPRYGYGEITREENPSKVCFFKDLVPIAEERLKSIQLPLEEPIVVIGDASGSMEVAIKTSTIIASLLTAITSARLVFFNTENREAPYLPTNAEQALELAVTTRAAGGTTPAASLWPFYDKKEVVKTFIMVTDEEENGSCHNYSFADLFKKYYEDVYPAKLVFVSFLRSQHSNGQMVQALRDVGINPLQFKMDGSRPDLSKLDNLFGLLSTEAESFTDEISDMEDKIRLKGLQGVFEELKSTEESS
ncbi:uncharacterized protein LOC121369645 [Gigantopelta aegis]|uniref:uncharacterized protein LOC121369645 n=1 Tax=Gigantopelta aegis TaxID=1735272 RepID=UPI001B88D569|nr:uncharacterized protein LOC121369645 [Gigantopelta aegis]